MGKGEHLFCLPLTGRLYFIMTSIPVIETEDCVGCGSCVEICPEVFILNESLEKAQVINPSGCPEEKINEAIETCPVNCIHWED